MAFIETRFPTDISYGSRGGPGFKTDIIALDSGQEQRISRHAAMRFAYDVAYGIKSKDQLRAAQKFFITMSGAASGFRFKDWLDFTTASDGESAPSNVDETLTGTVDGSNKVFQLVKTYTTGAVTKTRNIQKPVSGTTVISIDAVDQPSGWTVNTTTGQVTFSVAPTIGEVVKGGCEFDVPVRFGQGVDALLAASIDDFDTGALDSLPLIELKDEIDLPEQFFYGADVEDTLTADRLMSVGEGRAWWLDPDVDNHHLKLPDTTNLPSGAPYFYIINGSGTKNMLIRKSDDTAIMTLSAGDGVTAILSKDNAGVKEWVLY